MNINHSLIPQLLARDLLVKIPCGSGFNLPSIEKVGIHYTSKNVSADPKQSILAFTALQCISGQTPTVVRAKKAVATFKLKKKQIVGWKVTLRNKLMYNFLMQCTNIVLPQIKQFKRIQVSKSQPNIHFGIDQVLFFPALKNHVNVFETLNGFSIHLHTNAKTVENTLLICSGIKLPVKIQNKEVNVHN